MVWRDGIDHDPVALGDERDRPAVDRFGRDVPHTEAVRTAGEAAVGDERGVAPAPGALHRAGDREHLAHPRPTLRAFVTDHDDVARVDPAREDRLHRELLAVEDARGAVETKVVDTGDLHDATVRRERAPQHRDAAL